MRLIDTIQVQRAQRRTPSPQSPPIKGGEANSSTLPQAAIQRTQCRTGNAEAAEKPKTKRFYGLIYPEEQIVAFDFAFDLSAFNARNRFCPH
jgi:hypothetical protein